MRFTCCLATGSKNPTMEKLVRALYLHSLSILEMNMRKLGVTLRFAHQRSVGRESDPPGESFGGSLCRERAIVIQALRQCRSRADIDCYTNARFSPRSDSTCG